MMEILQRFWQPAIEILILAVGIYFVAVFVRGTRGAAILTGFLILFLALALVAYFLNLEVIKAIINQLSLVIATVVVVIFQPEVRHMLAKLGNVQLFGSTHDERENIEVIVQTVERLADVRIGMLVAIEQSLNLQDAVESGIPVDCVATPEMLETIFFPNNAIHDGGVILKDGRIRFAACIFPLSRRQDLNKSLGTRHRAALGLSEETDAIVVAVSEESGAISYAYKGQLVRGVSLEELRAFLTSLMVPAPARPRTVSAWFRNLTGEGARPGPAVITRNQVKPNEAARPGSS